MHCKGNPCTLQTMYTSNLKWLDYAKLCHEIKLDKSCAECLRATMWKTGNSKMLGITCAHDLVSPTKVLQMRWAYLQEVDMPRL